MTFSIRDFAIAVHSFESFANGQTLTRVFESFSTRFGVEALVQVEERAGKPDRWSNTNGLEKSTASHLAQLASISVVDTHRQVANLVLDQWTGPNKSPHRSVTLRVTKRFLTLPDHLKVIAGFLEDLSCAMEPIFGYGYESDARKFDFRLHPTLGILAGLPGIFPICVFGNAYVAHIGKKKLMQLPAESVVELSGGSILAVFVKSLTSIDLVEFHTRARAARHLLGEEFFVSRPEASASDAQRPSLFGALLRIGGVSGSKQGGWKVADSRPFA